jgi:ChrR-like protein with cupin domain
MTATGVRQGSIPICVRAEDMESSDDYCKQIERTNGTGAFLGVHGEDPVVGTLMSSKRGAPDLYSPRHRHTKAQVRYIMSGTMSFGPGVSASAGDCQIVPDGVFYGPLKPGDGDPPYYLQTQFTGASGQPLVNTREMLDRQAELASTGEFKQGIYYPKDGRPVDSFEAVTNAITHEEKTTYREPLVDDYLVVHTSELPWYEHAEGIAVKHVAYLFGTGPNVKLVRMEKGAVLPAGSVTCQQSRWLIDGAIRWDDEHFDALSAMFYPPDVAYPETRSEQGDTLLLVVQWTTPGRAPVPFAQL